MIGITNSPMNSALASTVSARIRADSRMISAKSAFWWLLGIGGLMLMVGVGVALGIYAYSYATDHHATQLADAVAAALDRVTLKTDGKVVLNTDGASVRLDSSGATVGLDTRGATVRLDASGLPTSWRPTEQQLGTNTRPQSNAKVVTNYTVFKAVKFGDGSVHTGWNFKSSEDISPTAQFCYYYRGSNTDDNMGMKYDIGINGYKVTSARGLPVNLDAAFANCTWFSSVN